jgi:hypothetical protein
LSIFQTEFFYRNRRSSPFALKEGGITVQWPKPGSNKTVEKLLSRKAALGEATPSLTWKF